MTGVSRAQPVGHPYAGVAGGDPVDQQAVVGGAGHDDRPAERAAVGEGPFRHVQPQAALPRLLVGPVAREAVLGEDRPDLAREVDDPLRRRRRVRRREFGPPVRAAVDPAADRVDLLGAERAAGGDRRHAPDAVPGGQPLEQRARLGVARDDDALEELVGVEPQVGLPRVLVRAVAEQARLGENRPHVPVELDHGRRLLRRRREIAGEGSAEPDREHGERNRSAERCLPHGHVLTPAW